MARVVKDDGMLDNHVGWKFLDELTCPGAALSAKCRRDDCGDGQCQCQGWLIEAPMSLIEITTRCVICL